MVRFKNRYLLGELVWEQDKVNMELNSKDLLNAIRQSVEMNFGPVGLGNVRQSLAVKYLNPVTQIFIVRSPRDYFQMVWQAMTFLSSLDSHRCILRVFHTSGTLRLAQQQCFNYDADLLRKYVSSQTSVMEKQKAEKFEKQQLQKLTDLKDESG
eukprot:GCRY01002943.1.p1 GENE.GCRY01002943.1~~GCRY01002943.1.p1  ORF type:complete len:154 (+),score=14.30 GCRY01002943.1:151-612(+)